MPGLHRLHGTASRPPHLAWLPAHTHLQVWGVAEGAPMPLRILLRTCDWTATGACRRAVCRSCHMLQHPTGAAAISNKRAAAARVAFHCNTKPCSCPLQSAGSHAAARAVHRRAEAARAGRSRLRHHAPHLPRAAGAMGWGYAWVDEFNTSTSCADDGRPGGCATACGPSLS